MRFIVGHSYGAHEHFPFDLSNGLPGQPSPRFILDAKAFSEFAYTNRSFLIVRNEKTEWKNAK